MFAEVNGTTLFWESHGSGRPMLMMHGGPGFDCTYFRPWFDELAQEIRLIYYDQRAAGRSDRKASAVGAALRTYVEDVEMLRTNLGLERLILFGHSFGGCLALAYALHYGHQLDGLILCATYPDLEHIPAALEGVVLRATADKKALLRRVLVEPMPDDETYKRTWLTLLPLYFAQYENTYGEAFRERVHYSAAAWNHLGQFADALSDYARRYKTACPVLILVGAQDWLTPTLQIKRLQAGLPHATVVRFEQSGHFPFMEEPRAFLATIKNWISKLP